MWTPTHLLPLLALLVSSASSASLPAPVPAPALAARYLPQGTISLPANGTHLAPGAPFAFAYTARGDYCLSSLHYSVWLLTAPPTPAGLGPAGSVGTGHYFGRFAAAGQGNPAPPNPPPAQLVMPDFSQPPGGFGAGKRASDVPMYLAVLEEWNDCSPTLGNTFSVAANSVVYNATAA